MVISSQIHIVWPSCTVPSIFFLFLFVCLFVFVLFLLRSGLCNLPCFSVICATVQQCGQRKFICWPAIAHDALYHSQVPRMFGIKQHQKTEAVQQINIVFLLHTYTVWYEKCVLFHLNLFPFKDFFSDALKTEFCHFTQFAPKQRLEYQYSENNCHACLCICYKFTMPFTITTSIWTHSVGFNWTAGSIKSDPFWISVHCWTDRVIASSLLCCRYLFPPSPLLDLASIPLFDFLLSDSTQNPIFDPPKAIVDFSLLRVQ